MTQAPDFPIDDESIFRRIVEGSAAAVLLWTTDVASRVVYASPRIEEITGFPAGELTSQPALWFSRLDAEASTHVAAGSRRALASQEPVSTEFRFQHRNGEWRWFRETTSALRGVDGSARFLQSFIEDITAERFALAQAERSEARYRALVEHLPAIVYVDSDDVEPRSLYVSPNSKEILGYEPRDYLADPNLWFDSMHPDDLARVRERWAASIRSRRPFEAEYRDVKPDGGVVWVRDRSILVRDDEGAALFWQGVLLDITAEREAKTDRRRTVDRYRALVDQVPAVMYEMGPDDERRTLFVSEHVERILGYPRQEWLDQPDIWIELLHPEDRETELAEHDRHNQTGEPWQRRYRLIAADGRVVWVRDHAELVSDDDGSRWLGVMLDITPQKEAEELLQLANDELEMRVLIRTAELEEANEMMGLEIGERRRVEAELRKADAKLRALIDHLPGAAYTWHVLWPGQEEDDPLPYMSPRIEEMLGYTPEEWQRNSTLWSERIHPHDRDRVLAATRRTEVSGEPFNEEFRYLAKDGRVVWVVEQATLLSRDDEGRPAYFQGVILDITDRKLAEAKAEAAEERFRLLAERSPIVVYMYELEHEDPPVLRMKYVSPAAEELLRTPIERWVGDVDAWFEHMHPDDVERMTQIARSALETGGPWNHTFRMIRGDGRIVWLLDRGRAIERDQAGRPTLFQGIFLDVTEEEEARLALEARERRYRSIVESLPAVPWSEVVDPDSGKARYVFIGPQVEAMFGYTAAELLMEPDHFFRLVHPDDRERVMTIAERCDRTGEPWDELYRVLHRDGSIRWILSRADRTFEDGRPVWHGLAFDLTRHIERGAIPPDVRAAVGSLGTVEANETGGG